MNNLVEAIQTRLDAWGACEGACASCPAGPTCATCYPGPDGLAQAMDDLRALLAERAAVVAWLRTEHALALARADSLVPVADAIERGEHLEEP